MEATEENSRIAVENAKKMLQLPATRNIATMDWIGFNATMDWIGRYQWIGVAEEILFELAMSLIYELVPDNGAQLEFFARRDLNPFYHSPLGMIIILIFFISNFENL